MHLLAEDTRRLLWQTIKRKDKNRMKKKRRTPDILRRIAALLLAVLLGFSGITDYVTVYATGKDRCRH